MTSSPSSSRQKLDWTALDDQAVDTVRVLAMDAVQKVGNGHPGTAMSLAPAAYLLFQKIMRHNPADPDWPGRDRFVLSCGHSSLTLYIQLYYAGYGLELDDLKALRVWGSLTPGHPEHGHTAGVETTTGPLGQGVANAVGMAMAARRERGLFDPAPAPGESLFDHDVFVIASDGDLEEGVSAEASSLAGHQELGNLMLLYDDNHISIEDNTDVAFSEDVAKRYEAYGWHVQTVDWTNGGKEYKEDVKALFRAYQAAKAETRRPSFIRLKTIIGWPAPTKQNTGKAHGSAFGDDEVAATKKVLGFDPEQTFAVSDDVIAHTRQAIERGKTEQAAWQERFDTWAGKAGDRLALYQRMRTRTLPASWADALPVCEPDAKGVATRVASGDILTAIAPVLPELWGGSADLAGSNNTTPKGEPSFLPPEHSTKEFAGDWYGRVLHFGIREHAMGSIDQRDRPPRRNPAVRRHLPGLLRLHAARGPARRPDEAAGHLRLDARLDRTRRGRSDPPADRAAGCAPRDPRARRGSAGRRQRDRRGLADHPRAHRPAGRPGSDPAERPDLPAWNRRLLRHLERLPRRLRARSTSTAAHPTWC